MVMYPGYKAAADYYKKFAYGKGYSTPEVQKIVKELQRRLAKNYTDSVARAFRVFVGKYTGKPKPVVVASGISDNASENSFADAVKHQLKAAPKKKFDPLEEEQKGDVSQGQGDSFGESDAGFFPGGSVPVTPGICKSPVIPGSPKGKNHLGIFTPDLGRSPLPPNSFVPKYGTVEHDELQVKLKIAYEQRINKLHNHSPRSPGYYNGTAAAIRALPYPAKEALLGFEMSMKNTNLAVDHLVDNATDNREALLNLTHNYVFLEEKCRHLQSTLDMALERIRRLEQHIDLAEVKRNAHKCRLYAGECFDYAKVVRTASRLYYDSLPNSVHVRDHAESILDAASSAFNFRVAEEQRILNERVGAPIVGEDGIPIVFPAAADNASDIPHPK